MSSRRSRLCTVAPMASQPTSEIERAGRLALADELYDLRCELALAELGERAYQPAQLAQMRERAATLEALVGAELNALLAAED